MWFIALFFLLFVQIGKAFGIESHVLSPSETKKLYPLLNVEDLYGTLYSPGDGTVDPAGFCVSLVRGASKAGAKVMYSWKICLFVFFSFKNLSYF